MVVRVVNRETNELVFSSDTIYGIYSRNIIKQEKKIKYVSLEERDGFETLFPVNEVRIFKEVFV